MAGSTRGFGPGLRGANGRPSRRSSCAIHSGAPSGRPMVGPRSIRAVVSGSGRRCQKRGKIGHQGAQRGYPRQLVVLAREMRAGVRPRPVFGAARQLRDYRIEHDVTRGRHQVRLVHYHCAEAALERMPRPAEPRVDGPRVAPVRFGKRRPQPIAAGWRHDQMDMIGH
jgi:hypothetical protein